MKTTINIDDDLLKMVKLKAVDDDVTITELITVYFKYGLTNHNRISKFRLEKDYNRYKKRFNNKSKDQTGKTWNLQVMIRTFICV